MAKRPRNDEEPSMDSLLDALTNVVGILLLILIITSLGLSAAVKEIVENLPEVSEAELEQMKESVDKTRENLKSLEITQEDQSPIDEKEVQQIILEIEDIEKDNKDLAEKTSDLDELQKKIEEETAKKEINVEEVNIASTELAELKAILDQTPVPEIADATIVRMPNPRRPEERESVHYILCKFGKLFWVGDPYDHTLKVSEVIDQNFQKLAYTGTAMGSYTFSFLGKSLNDNRTNYEVETESVRRNARFVKESGWDALQSPYATRSGAAPDYIYEAAAEKTMLDRLFGTDDRRDFPIMKFRVDPKKIADFFGDGKLGPAQFKYHVIQNGTTDRLKLQLEPKEEKGWTIQQFTQPGSDFVKLAKGVQNSRGYVYYQVAPDSFDVYLKARDISERMRIKAGWTTYTGDKLELRASPLRQTMRYNMDDLPKADYLKIANTIGPALLKTLQTEIESFDSNLAAIKLDDIKDPAEKTAALARLKTDRGEFLVRYLSPWSLDLFKGALAATEAKGEKEVQVDVHPPEIPFNRLFLARGLPTKPSPPVDPNRPKPPPRKGPPTPTGGAVLILD